MKPLPHDLIIERAFLSSILVGGEEFIVWSLLPQDFYKKSHQRIYAEMCKSSREGLNPDAVTVAVFLPELLSEINQLLDAATSPALNPQYARLLKDLSRKRQLILEYSTALNSLYETDNLDVTLEQTDNRINKIMGAGVHRKSGVSLDNVYDNKRMAQEYEQHIQKLREGVFATGIDALDSVIRGVAGGEVLTILARAGCFKTAFMQYLLLRGNKDRLAVFFSIEMPVSAVFERFGQGIVNRTGHEIEQDWLSGRVSDQQRGSIEFGLGNLIVVPSRPTVRQMERYVYLVERKYKRKVDIVGIDYLGLVDGPGDSEYAKNSSVAVDVKTMAKSLKIPVVLLSQLSRKGGDGTERVSLDMARGSGQIEEAADFIFGLWKKMTGEESFDLILSVLKNRKGPVNRDFRLYIEPEFMKFSGGDAWIETKPLRRQTSNEGL